MLTTDSDEETSPDNPSAAAAVTPKAPGLGRIILLGTLAMLLWLISLRIQAGSNATTFYPYAIPILGWYVLGTLAFALVLGGLTRPKIGVRLGLVITLSLAPAAILADLLLDHFRWVQQWTLVLGVTLLAGGLYLTRRLQRITGTRQIGAVLLALLGAGAFAGLNRYLYVEPSLWYSAQEVEAPDRSALSKGQVESLLFSQPARVDQALERLGPRELGPSAYFLGFAGYAEEKVFAEEIRFAAQRIDARFGSGQRTLFLLNDVRDRSSTPLASVSTLRRALNGLQQHMDPNEDLLVLALSSHGSETAELAVSNGNVPLQSLSAGDLRSLLDDAGIRWRLLLISACYAGSFIDTLATDYTAVIAAAAADRTSFGCSNDRDLTYFGEAFYRDALPGAHSIPSAFGEAVKLVTQRELAADVTPSMPAAFFGSQIETKLHTMTEAARLRSQASRRAAQPGTNP